jgi:trigger factor
MKVSLTKEGQNVVKMDLEIDTNQAQVAYDKICRKLSHRLNIPGFRRGKAPRKIVENAVGVDYIKREALEDLLPHILEKVISDEKLDVITRPHIESYEYELGQPIKLNAMVEVRPEIILEKYQGLTVEVEEAKSPDDALDNALTSLARSKSKVEKVESRKIVEGDTVLLDFECYVDNELVEGGKSEGLLLEIKKDNFLPGFCEQLIGLTPEQKTEIKATFPENYRNSSLAGKNGIFKADIREIRQRVMPELNDEFAKSFGQETLEALKTLIKERLDQEMAEENESRRQRALVDAVVKGSKVEIPESMIDRECNLLLAHYKRYTEQSGQKWETFVQSEAYESFYKEQKEEAQKRVLTSLVLGQIVKTENISVTEEEVAPYLAERVARYNVPIEKLLQNEDYHAALDEDRRLATEEALTLKVVEFLKSKNEIKFVAENTIRSKTPA